MIELEKLIPMLRGSEKDYRSQDGRVFFIEPPADFVPSDSEKEGYYDRGRWTKWRQSNFNYFQEELDQEDKNKIFLDLGSGASTCMEITNQFKNYLGIDFFPYESAKIVADIGKPLPLKDGVCEIVFLSNVLEHVPAPDLLINECHRVLKPGGFLIGAVPFMAKVHQEPYDFLRYTNHMLELLFKNAGFKRREIKSLGAQIDLYETAQRRFFSQLYASDLTYWERIQFRIADRLTGWLTALFRSVYSKAKPSLKFTEGYGFKAYK